MSSVQTKPKQRSKSQPPPVAGSKKRSRSPQASMKPVAEWNDNIRDPEEYRATTEERSRKAASRVSKNLNAAKVQLQEKQIKEVAEKNRIRGCSKAKAITKQVIVSSRELENLLEESDRVLAESRNLLAEHQRNFSSLKGTAR